MRPVRGKSEAGRLGRAVASKPIIALRANAPVLRPQPYWRLWPGQFSTSRKTAKANYTFEHATKNSSMPVAAGADSRSIPRGRGMAQAALLTDARVVTTGASLMAAK